jgi:hypothetical protein
MTARRTINQEVINYGYRLEILLRMVQRNGTTARKS